MKIAKRTMGGLAAAVGLCALSATPGLAQDFYVRTIEPMGPAYGSGVIVREAPAYEPDYVVTAPPRIVVRKAPVYVQAPRVIVREAPVEPYASSLNNIYVRNAPPYPAPAAEWGVNY